MPCTAQSSAGGAAMRVADAPRGTSGKHVERGGPLCARWPEAVVARGAEEEGAAAAATTTAGGGAPVLCAMTLGRTTAGAYGTASGVAIDSRVYTFYSLLRALTFYITPLRRALITSRRLTPATILTLPPAARLPLATGRHADPASVGGLALGHGV